MCLKNLAFEILKPPHKQCFENRFVGVRRKCPQVQPAKTNSPEKSGERKIIFSGFNCQISIS
jgi:hypothetical protein